MVKSKDLHQQSSLSLDKTETDDEKRLSLTNPTYQPTAFQLVQRTGTPEHKFLNPLYAPVEQPNSRQHNSNIIGADYEYIEYT